MSPRYLTLDEVFAIHLDQIQRYGGGIGLRDLGLLESAIAQPLAMFAGEFLHVDLIEVAAAYLFHLVQNHPFVDGNKRGGAASALVFLELNGIRLAIPEEDLVKLVLDVAQGICGKPAMGFLWSTLAN